MRTLRSQRLKKQAEKEFRHRTELLEQILGDAQAELEQLASLLGDSSELIVREAGSQTFKEYREEDAEVYFEEGFVER